MKKELKKDIILFFVVGFVLFFFLFNVTHAQGVVVCDDPPNCTFSELIQTADKVVNYLVTISASVAAILIAYAGILYVTAGGNSSKIQQANKIFSSVAIGFIIVLAGWLIIKTILTGLGANTMFKNLLS